MLQLLLPDLLGVTTPEPSQSQTLDEVIASKISSLSKYFISYIVALTLTQRPQVAHIMWVNSNGWFGRRLKTFAQIYRMLLRFCSDNCPDLTRLWNLCEYIENDPHQEHKKWRRPCNQTHSISLSTPQSSSNSSTGITLSGWTIERRSPKQHNEIDKLINPIFHFWMFKVPHAVPYAILCISSCHTLDVIFTLLHCYNLSVILFHYSPCFVM